MSVLDQVRSLEQQVLQRLGELRPLVAEYRDLERLAERLGLKRDADERDADATVDQAATAGQAFGDAGCQARGEAPAGHARCGVYIDSNPSKESTPRRNAFCRG